MNEPPPPRPRHQRSLVLLLFAVAAGAAIAGFFEFRFLTDDAYISFRYISNALHGRGLTWNPAPFLPVEGYTNFAWVALLGGVWGLTGIEPPAAANPIALAFGLAQLALVLRIALRMPLPESIERARLPLAALVLLGTATNRTFLTWLSSGLETSLFNFALTAWIAFALELASLRTARTFFALSASAAVAALTRPDGWLAVLACVPLALATGRERDRPTTRTALAWSPLLLPLLHVAWRRSYYGEWLPNTWFAKHLGAWPESGLRYGASFAIENGVWIWLCLVIAWLARRPHLTRVQVVVVATLLAHFAYYTLVIGGDHFEYRVYSHLVPLLFVSAVWLAAALGLRATGCVATLLLFVAASWPIPWTHHLATRDLKTREQTHELIEPVAPLLPPPLSWLAEPFDRFQAWLIPRHVGMRHREHAVYHDALVRVLPSRAQGSQLDWKDRHVLSAGNVGVIGWVFPNVAIIDVLGLNDHVVARTPPPAKAERDMAHDRPAPAEYIACFRPDLQIELPRRFTLVERAIPLRDEDIVACERSWRAREGRATGAGSG